MSASREDRKLVAWSIRISSETTIRENTTMSSCTTQWFCTGQGYGFRVSCGMMTDSENETVTLLCPGKWSNNIRRKSLEWPADQGHQFHLCSGGLLGMALLADFARPAVFSHLSEHSRPIVPLQYTVLGDP